MSLPLPKKLYVCPYYTYRILCLTRGLNPRFVNREVTVNLTQCHVPPLIPLHYPAIQVYLLKRKHQFKFTLLTKYRPPWNGRKFGREVIGVSGPLA